MTREEAIKTISKMLAVTDLTVRGNMTAKMVEACHIAIRVLEQEPCEDCISRQAAIEAVIQAIYNHDSAIMRLTELPPVTPVEKSKVQSKKEGVTI